jgi:NADH dehydrogenase [ubiquinone] 1 alpha subcomplex assembly factor 7
VVRAAFHASASSYGPLPQATLLRRLGIEARAAALRARASPDAAAAIDAALHRLLAPGEMGRLFKALAITPDSDSPRGFGRPPGFEESDDFSEA